MADEGDDPNTLLRVLADCLWQAGFTVLPLGQALQWLEGDEADNVAWDESNKLLKLCKCARELIQQGAASGCPPPAGQDAEAWLVNILNGLEALERLCDRYLNGGVEPARGTFASDARRENPDLMPELADGQVESARLWVADSLPLSQRFTEIYAHLDNVLTVRAGAARAIAATAGASPQAADAETAPAPSIDDSYVEAKGLWPRYGFIDYKDFRRWLDRSNVRHEQRGQRRMVHAADLARAMAKRDKQSDEALDIAGDIAAGVQERESAIRRQNEAKK